MRKKQSAGTVSLVTLCIYVFSTAFESEFYAFLIKCLITVLHFSGATFRASDIYISWCKRLSVISFTLILKIKRHNYRSKLFLQQFYKSLIIHLLVCKIIAV